MATLVLVSSFGSLNYSNKNTSYNDSQNVSNKIIKVADMEIADKINSKASSEKILENEQDYLRIYDEKETPTLLKDQNQRPDAITIKG